jgi:hypothetical protein
VSLGSQRSNTLPRSVAHLAPEVTRVRAVRELRAVTSPVTSPGQPDQAQVALPPNDPRAPAAAAVAELAVAQVSPEVGQEVNPVVGQAVSLRENQGPVQVVNRAVADLPASGKRCDLKRTSGSRHVA